jgi:16S rRNA (cytosine967-C5)-methyltransferase
MTPAARLSAAVEVLGDIEARRRPAADALKDWGLSHRFAGSGDRAAIAALVYDALRRRSSAAALMGAVTPRAVLIGALNLSRGLDVEALSRLCSGERFAPAPLTDAERDALARGLPDDAPEHIRGDYPEWLDPAFAEAFGEGRAEELAALTQRAPVDLRVNTLKADRDEVAAELGHLGVEPTRLSSVGLRIRLKDDGRAPSVQAEPAFLKGKIEIQDEGSQLVAQLAGVDPGMQVVDLCAGGGGKTLALAALMDNHGQIFATDNDKRRLAPIHERLDRAGVRNAQVRTPKTRDDDPLADCVGRMDLVVVDAPCTGTGTWRRNPDAKWRVRPSSLDDRVRDQAAVLDRAARLVKKSGRIAYVTCSLLPAENDGAVRAFLERHDGFEIVDPEAVARDGGLPDLGRFRSPGGTGLLLTPRRTGTDGFFLAQLRRRT